MVVRKRLQITGSALAFITTTATDGVPVFADDEIAGVVLDQFDETLQHFGVFLVGYVLMPTHLHALLSFPHIEELSHFMQSFKILSAKRVKELESSRRYNQLWSNGSFRLWKIRFDDLIVTSEEQFRVKLDYIHNNPVKAGLVLHPADWRNSSAGDWLKDVPGRIRIEKTFGWLRE